MGATDSVGGKCLFKDTVPPLSSATSGLHADPWKRAGKSDLCVLPGTWAMESLKMWV